MLYSKFINLNLLFKLTKYFNKLGCKLCTKENLEYSITGIKSRRRGVLIKNHKFPLNFRNKEGAILISAFLHDGGISSKLGLHYRNNKKILRKEVYDSVCKVIGLPKAKSCNPSKIKMFFSKTLGLMLVYGLNMKNGDKISNPEIPKFLFNLNRKVRAEFVRHAIDDDGWVDKHSRSVGMELAVDTSLSPNTPPKLLLDNKRLIESLGIDVLGPYLKSYYKRKDSRKTSRWYIVVKGKKNLLKLSECQQKIYYKRRNLKKIVNSFVQEQFSRKKCFNIYLQNIKKLQEEGKQINRITLAKKVKRSEKTTSNILKNMKDKGIITIDKIGTGGFIHYPTTYKIVKVISRPGQHGVVNVIKIEKK